MMTIAARDRCAFGRRPALAFFISMVALMVWLFGGQKAAAAGASSATQAGQLATGAGNAPDSQVDRLEVRGVGITIDQWAQTEIWSHIEKKNATHESFLSRAASDYPSTWTDRSAMSKLTRGLALKLGAGDAVEYTPLPVFVYGPPRHPENLMGAAFSVNYARQEGSLPFDLFVIENAVNGSGPSLAEVFKFFDANPNVPFALIFCTDGMVTRKLLEKPGSGLIPDGAAVPAVFNSNVALLVSRPHAIDRLRPSVVTKPESVDTRETQYDLVKLWNFYWDETDVFDTHYETDLSARGKRRVSPHTMSAAWWRSRVPDLLKHTENRGPGEFVPNPWTPVRWTDWQVKQFDESPVLGYIDRPVSVRLADKNGHALREKEQASALRDGWSRLIAQGHEAVVPQRIFFDTTGDREWVIPLTQALGAEPDAPSTGNVAEGFDVGYRIGNTGISSGAVQIALALIAGYQDGKVSAIVDRSDVQAEIVRVTPPSQAQVKQNYETRGDNPFLYR
ncbi:type VI lipase adapter Tla3 domain-containing protein [Paraburkholderia tropica]|uniref:type VI lipase adapter Tla3 domain-containing protein n=1 Tax=Paraburkholderia tropica TaxID=92647 RepID=UPI002AB0B7C4|nr:DUF2875 family protein [Paraburkholderia tropica]